MRTSELKTEELQRVQAAFLFRNQTKELILTCLGDARCILESFSKGEVIYRPDAFRRCLGILVAGSVKVSKGNLAVSTLSPGDLFGAAALFHDRGAYEATLTAGEPARVVLLPQALVAELMARYPALSANYILYLSGRIHFLNRKLDGLLAPGATEKLSRYLRGAAGEDGEVACPATELARRLDVSRASLYRAFAQLEAEGAIERRGKTVRVIKK